MNLQMYWRAAYAIATLVLQFIYSTGHEIGVVQRNGLDIELLLNSHTVDDVAKAFAVNRNGNRKTVVTSSFYLKEDTNAPGKIQDTSKALISNLYGNLQQIGLDKNLIALCGHAEHCRLCWMAGLPVFLAPLALKYHRRHYIHEPIRGFVTKLKWLMASKFLQAGYDTLFLDWDIGLMPHPERSLWDVIDAEPHDIMALSDWRGRDFRNRTQLPPQDAWNCPAHYDTIPNPCASTGVMHLAASNQTAAFAREVWRISITEQKWEQAVFNQLLPFWTMPVPYRDRSEQLQFQLFPYPEVCNLVAIKEDDYVASQMSRVILVHCGYIDKAKDRVLRRGHRRNKFLREYPGESVRLVALRVDIPTPEEPGLNDL